MNIAWNQSEKVLEAVLEHGGVAPAIVENDADFAEMIPDLVRGSFYHAGQVCVSVQKIYVNRDLCDLFIEKFVQANRKLIVGDPFDSATDVGPLITLDEVDRIEELILLIFVPALV
jgi:acyl-CoA reductase-like NAD-dependent aldehyde dehydrogenase